MFGIKIGQLGCGSRPSGAAPVLWTPTQINSQLAAWFDASDVSTLTDVSGAASQWNDKGPSARIASQSTAGWRPAIASNAINGLTALSFDGSDDEMVLNTAISILDNFTATFSVFRRNAASIDSVDIASPSSLYGTWWYANDNFLYSNLRSPEVVHGSANTTTGVFVSAMVRDNSGTVSWLDGSQNGTAQGASNNINGNMNLIGRVLTGERHTGLMGEILVVRPGAALAPATRQLIEGYLAWKWGTAGKLPAGHPYKSAAPTV
jgi:hypothetical protein